MAETRKHRVKVRDELDKALYAALGQPVRPVEPGSRPAPAGDAQREPGASEQEGGGEQHGGPKPASFITPGSTVAGFTFGQIQPPSTD